MRPTHLKCRFPRGPSCTYPIRPTAQNVSCPGASEVTPTLKDCSTSNRKQLASKTHDKIILAWSAPCRIDFGIQSAFDRDTGKLVSRTTAHSRWGDLSRVLCTRNSSQVTHRVHQFSSLEPAAQQAANEDECNASRRRPHRNVQLTLEIALDDEILRTLVIGPRRIQIRFLPWGTGPCAAG